MHGETNLKNLIKNMQPILHTKTYVFCSGQYSLADITKLNPVMFFKENEGITLILDQETAEKAGMSSTYPSRMITLNINSSLEAVGFLATITKKLAEHKISVNPISAYYHDHIFIPENAAHKALDLLQELSNE